MLLLTVKIQAQPIEKATLIRIEKCKFLEEGGYKVLSAKPAYRTFLSLGNKKLILRTTQSTTMFKLFDEQINTSNDDTVYSYYTKWGRELRMMAIRKCEDILVIALFPMNGSDNFTQYIAKCKKSGWNTNK